MNCIKIYKLANKLYKKRIPFLPWLLTKLGYILFNSHIPYTAQIGNQSKCAYGGIGVVIHSKAIIGDRVILGQGITIGRQLDPVGIPVIGDDVYISAGARILGDIKIGSNVIIGANAVVINDVPSNSIVAGVPARIIKSVEQPIYELLKNVY